MSPDKNLSSLGPEFFRNSPDEIRVMLAAIEQLSELVVVTDLQGVVIHANPAVEAISGYSPAEITGRKMNLLRSGVHGRAFYKEVWSTILGGRTWRGIFKNKRKDGTLYDAESTISPVRDRDGEIRYFVGVQKDVTGERELKKRLNGAQRMEAIGRLAGGVAHDFNNLLTVISGAASFLKGSTAPNDPRMEDVDDILKTVKRASDLTRQLLLFSRRQKVEPRAVALDEAVAGMERLLRRIIGEDIELEMDLACGPARIWIDPGKLEQVIMNLAVNARDSMPEGGRLTLRTRRLDFTRTARELSPLAPGPYLRLTTADTGCGMDEDTLQHAFEPFFSTKKEKGTGLGLSTAYGVVTQAGGCIEAESLPGMGTVFTMHFPVTEKEAAKKPAHDGKPRAPGSTGTVLVAEDDAPLLNTIQRTLERGGFTVIPASDGAAALEAAASHEGTIDLFLTDVVMPRMGGADAAREFAAARPGARVLFMSGHIDERFVPKEFLESKVRLIQKPFNPSELLAAVREALA